MNKQLIKEECILCEPRDLEKVDFVYIRNKIADIFMLVEPFAGRRETVVTETRNAVDFAQILKYMSDVLYPRAEKIVLVTDNLNIHAEFSLNIKHSSQKKRAVWLNGLNGIIPQNMGVGSTC